MTAYALHRTIMRKIGFTRARRKTIAALEAGPQFVLFEDRAAREGKNLLDTGEVTPGEVVALLRACRGTRDQYEETPHHVVPGIPVHVFRPSLRGVRWYVKVYFLAGGDELEPAIFISVHRSSH